MPAKMKTKNVHDTKPKTDRTITMDNLTVEQISNLRREAIHGDDRMQVAICELALYGQHANDYDWLNLKEAGRIAAMTQEQARMEIVRVLNEVVRY